MRHAVAMLLSAVALLVPQLAAAQDRYALVIGNNRYTNLPADKQLSKAVNDARSVGDALEKIGFKVIRGENLDRQGMVDRIFTFTQQIKQGDIAVLFYAGHGVAISGGNYLLPSDVRSAAPGEESRVRNMAIGEADIVADIQDKKARVAVLLLDACRDNPFRQPGLLRSAGENAGLTRGREGEGVFAVYSAGFGQSALDSLGSNDTSQNSVFTRVLVPALGRTDAHLGDIVVDMREEVAKLAATVNHQQFPAYYDQTRGGRVYLAPRGTAAPAPAAPVIAPPPVVASPPPAAPPQQRVASAPVDINRDLNRPDARGFPSKPITLVVPFAPGGAADLLARQIGVPLQRILGQPVVVTSRAGGGGTVGAAEVARAAADGHTLVLGNSATHAAAAAIYPKLDYDPVGGFEPVSLVAATPIVILTSTGRPQKTLGEFVAFAKANAGSVKMISLGQGTVADAACLSFNQANGLQPATLAVQGTGPAFAAMLSGAGDYLCVPSAVATSLLTEGRARALAVASHRRLAALPNVPTAAEAGLKDFIYYNWTAVFAPKGTPAPVVAKLSAAILSAMSDAEVAKAVTASAHEVLRRDNAGPGPLAELQSSDIAWLKTVLKPVN
ncbi:MAG: hypothetical protein A4S14_13055 [Proteobacteria bacterium SG_bin9]|nr:MAG: hypothetical protein A4S14_13055 [Proteobacteria bacterium SG_bin9]